MSFASQETSIESGRPVELYTLTLSSQTYRYTSAEDDQVVAGNTYSAIAISRDRLKQQTQENRSLTLVIKMPGEEPLPSRYVSSAPSERAVVTIQQFHRGDGALSTIFSGVLKSVAFEQDGNVAKLAVEPDIVATSRQIPLVSFSGQCSAVLGDGFAGGPGLCDVDLNNAAFRLDATCTAQSGLTLTVPGAAAFGDGWFNGGKIQTSGGIDVRLVISQVGDVITVHVPFPFPVVGELVTLRAGCGHDLVTCGVKFNKVDRYQGFAFVPTRNPFDSGGLDPGKC